MIDNASDILVRNCEKLIRQRNYYYRLARKWERERDNPGVDPDTRAALVGKVDTILRCAKDLQFILTQCAMNVPSHEWDAIEQLALDTQTSLDDRRRASMTAEQQHEPAFTHDR